MFKNSRRTWIVALALGWLFDFLFWKHTPGVNFAIYATLCLAGGYFILSSEGVKPAKRTLWLLIPIIGFAVISFTRMEGFTIFLSIALTLLLLGLLASTYLGGRWLEFGLADYITSAFRLAGGAIAKPFLWLTMKHTGRGGSDPAAPARKSPWPVLRGLLFALPILIIFASLLASADLIFAQKLDDFIALFKLERLPEYILRLGIILTGAFLLVGVFLHAALSSANEKLTGAEKPLVQPFLGFTEAGIILGSLAVLFAVFVVIQFQYFFGGQANIHIDGYTYADYARKGFSELVTVALFSLLLLLGLSGITQRSTPFQRKLFSALGITLVVLVGIMLVSAFQRLVLYETAYGFTRLRAYTHVFMLWLAVLLVAVAVLEFLHLERRFALAAFLTLIGFGFSLAFLNVDGFIVKQNVQRAVQGNDLDVGYLATLSTDAVPVLSQVFTSSKEGDALHEQVGAALVCLQEYRSFEPENDWRSFNLSAWRANKIYSGLQTELDRYPLNQNGTPPFVITPANGNIPCFTWYMD